MTKKKKMVWIELLRITACFAVIFLHVATQYFKVLPVDGMSWKIANFYNGIARFGVACFVMISGSLYLDRNRKWDIKKLLKKSVIPLLAAYYFWEVFYAAYRIIARGSAVIGSLTFYKKILTCMTQSYYHLWYLPMLIGLLLLVPFLWEIVNSSRGKKCEEYLIALFFVFNILVTTIEGFPLPFKEQISNVLNTVQPDLIIGFVGYFVLGHYLAVYGVPKKTEYIIYALGVSGILGGIFLCQYYSSRNGAWQTTHYGNFTVAVFFYSVAIFLFFRCMVSRIHWKEKSEQFICRISSCTFGIYLIHPLFVDILKRMGIDTKMFHMALSVPILTGLVFLLSFISAAIIKKIPFIGRWIM